ncbi:MAG: sigma-70 family RNA polymerase sigma factor [Acidobacteriota bacterium]|nr:sigma-70 family RNA polymerase sigma factor [Blastocatellia bacterium]MDW8239543.1 sigma-70 family RNA polymerase sigma factor [Acidobacteriota bacterium]
MTDPSTKDLTRLLVAWRNGDQRALDQLMPIVYEELHRLAQHYMHGERSDHTLQPTALIHEAYLRLIELKDITWQDRVHFFAVAAQMMRRVLVDYAKSHRAAKRGSGEHKLSLEEAADVAQERTPDLVALDEALQSLAAIDPRKSQIVELKFFGGLTIEETAEALGISHATVERELKMAMAWLGREMKK